MAAYRSQLKLKLEDTHHGLSVSPKYTVSVHNWAHYFQIRTGPYRRTTFQLL